MATDAAIVQAPSAVRGHTAEKRTFLLLSIALVLLHVFFMLYRYGQLPAAPVVSDEVVINDPSVSLAHGHGYIAESFGESKYGLDKVFAHFPPVYPYTEAAAFRAFGVSAYSLRLTTTVMSVGSTVVLMLLLYRLCVFGMMSWDVALLVLALYCTNASNVALERTARMESMVSLLVLLSLYGILGALTLPTDRRLPWLLAGGICGALTIAVHPEACTAVLLLAVLILFVVPTTLTVRLTAAALFVLTPLAVGVAIYRTNFFAAVRQFLAIAHDANTYSRTSYEWMLDALHVRDVSTVSKNVFLLLLLLLMAVPAATYAWKRQALPRDSLQKRMLVAVGAVGIVEILLMVFVFHMDARRCQFLFGALLVCVAICVWGNGSLQRWERLAGWFAVLLQCLVACFYLYPRQNRIADMNPERFATVVRDLPRGAATAATPGLWLDMKEADRPFTLILNGLDGVGAWGPAQDNPLKRFDIVVLESGYTRERPWLNSEALDGRTRTSYVIGSGTVDVYVRSATKQ